ncbi:MAG: hypothetical protein IPN71_00175 [Fibrobacteres bacterium]|jgi:hypothetical protein|nr:hypothetical protein [Fibrobacterota bacterium]
MEFEFFKQFTDDDFFSNNLMAGLEEAILDLDDSSAIRLGGPRIWDPSKQDSYRALTGFKLQAGIHRAFLPKQRAEMILIDLATGSTSMEGFEASGKSASGNQAPTETMTTAVKCARRSIRFPSSKFLGPWGTWRLFVFSGKILSNPLDFETGHRELTEKDRQIPPHLLRAPTDQELSSQVFAQRPASPQLNAPGIAFLQEAGETSVDARRWMYPLDLTLFVADDFPPQQHWIPVRLLFGSDVNWANHSMEILIPKERTTKVEGGLVGHYTLDLAPLLIDSSTGIPVQPKEWYLTAICKGVIAEPQALTIPVR